MKPLIQDSVGTAMATKCSSNASMVTEYTVPMRSHRGHRNAYANHRKSAVELLEASKGAYVKSTKVLNHKQKLKHPENLSVGNRDAPVLSLPITGKPLDDAVTVTTDNTPDTTSHPITSAEQRSLNNSPSTLHTENLEPPSNNSQSPPSVRKLASSASHSTDAVLPSSTSSPTPSSVSSSVVSASSPTTSNTSSVRKTSKISSAVSTAASSASFTTNSQTIITTSSVRKASATSSAVTSAVSSAVSSASFTTNSPTAAKKLSIASSAASSLSFTSSQSNSRHDEDQSSFKKALTSPSTATVRPVVPPKPANKPSVAPKVGPKPVIHQISDKSVPPPRPAPPRPARKPSAPKKSETADENIDTSERIMSSTETKTSVSSNNQVSNGPEQKRFSSVSASACETSLKESESVDGVKGKSRPARESRYSLSSQSDVFLKPLNANSLSTSVGVLVERKRSPMPKPRIDKQLNEVELPPRRPLHRSQSDLSNCRHSRTSSDFSDLSSRLSRTSTEVERFFNEMGIDHSVLEPMRRLSETKHRGTLDSVSSLDSLDGRSLSSRLSNDLDRLPMESEQDLSERDAGTTSVVERNARIIKWLCNVKKARTVQTKHINRKS